MGEANGKKTENEMETCFIEDYGDIYKYCSSGFPV